MKELFSERRGVEFSLVASTQLPTNSFKEKDDE